MKFTFADWYHETYLQIINQIPQIRTRQFINQHSLQSQRKKNYHRTFHACYVKSFENHAVSSKFFLNIMNHDFNNFLVKQKIRYIADHDFFLDMLRLQQQQPDLGQRDIWSIPVYRLFCCAQISGRPCHLYSLHTAGHQLDMAATPSNAGRRKCQCCKFPNTV